MPPSCKQLLQEYIICIYQNKWPSYYIFTEGKVYAETRTVNDWIGGAPSPRRAYLDDHGERYDYMAAQDDHRDSYGGGGQLLRVAGSSHFDHPARTPSPTVSNHRRQRLAAATAAWPTSAAPRIGHTGGGRRLPATPNQPSTLNIDSLTNVAAVTGSTNVGTQPSKDNNENQNPNRLSINFPKLNLSPSRSSLLNNLKNRTLGSVVGNTGQGTGGSGARLPDPPVHTTAVANLRRQLPKRGGRWSRSLDDPATFEEVVRAGRGKLKCFNTFDFNFIICINLDA